MKILPKEKKASNINCIKKDFKINKSKEEQHNNKRNIQTKK